MPEINLEQERIAFESTQNTTLIFEKIEYVVALNAYMPKLGLGDSLLVMQVAERFNFGWSMWQARAQVAPGLVLELEKGRFIVCDLKELLFSSLKSSKILKTKQNWVHVMHMLGKGSTASYRICTALNINPEGTKFEAESPAND